MLTVLYALVLLPRAAAANPQLGVTLDAPAEFDCFSETELLAELGSSAIGEVAIAALTAQPQGWWVRVSVASERRSVVSRQLHSIDCDGLRDSVIVIASLLAGLLADGQQEITPQASAAPSTASRPSRLAPSKPASSRSAPPGVAKGSVVKRVQPASTRLPPPSVTGLSAATSLSVDVGWTQRLVNEGMMSRLGVSRRTNRSFSVEAAVSWLGAKERWDHVNNIRHSMLGFDVALLGCWQSSLSLFTFNACAGSRGSVYSVEASQDYEGPRTVARSGRQVLLSAAAEQRASVSLSKGLRVRVGVAAAKPLLESEQVLHEIPRQMLEVSTRFGLEAAF